MDRAGLDQAIAISTMCDSTETNPSLPERNFAIRDNEGRGTDQGTCQTNTELLKELGYASYFDRQGRWRPAWAKDRNKFGKDGKQPYNPNYEPDSRRMAGKAIKHAVDKIRRLGWRESAYNLGSLLCAYSRVPGEKNGCHTRALRFAEEYNRRLK